MAVLNIRRRPTSNLNMPGMGATDPADIVAQARREVGLSRQLKVQRRERPHKSRGGTTGYPEWYREEQLLRHQNGEEVDVSAASISRGYAVAKVIVRQETMIAHNWPE